MRLVARRPHERPQPDPDRAHVLAPRRAREVAARLGEDEADVLRKGPGLVDDVGARRVGGAEDRLAHERHREQHAAVGRLRHQQRMRAGQEVPVDDQVHALTRRDHRRTRWRVGVAVHVAHRVDPDPGGVDDAARGEPALAPGLDVAPDQPAHLAALAHEADRGAVVEQHRPALQRRARQRDREARVVELAVPVAHAAHEPARVRARQQLERAVRAQPLGGAQAMAAGKRVVGLEADAVEARLPPVVGRHHEAHALRQVRGIGEDRAALVQRLAHEADVALREVAHAAVHELSGARARALAEVVRLDENDGKAARRGVERDAEPGGAAADDRQVPRLGARLGEAGEQHGAIGRSVHRTTFRAERSGSSARGRPGASRSSRARSSRVDEEVISEGWPKSPEG